MNIEKYWDKLSDKFDNKAMKFEQTYIKTVQNTKKHLNIDDIVLDYACGTGLICNEIADKVKKIYAIDISSKMIDIAKRKAIERKIENIDFAQSTLFDERYQKESFDVIMAFNIFLHLKDIQKVIQRINELLKPGGLIISATGCLGENKTFVFALISLLIKIGVFPYMRFFKIPELEDLMTNGNFQIVETVSVHQNPTSYFIVAMKI